MLLGNHSVLHKLPLRFLAGSAVSVEPQLRSNSNKSGNVRNRFYIDQASVALSLYAIPQGAYVGTAWLVPQKAGNIASPNTSPSAADAAAALAAGVNFTAQADSTSGATGTGQLISSASGTAASTSGASGTAFASLAAAGSADSTSTASGTATGNGFMIGQADSTSAASLTRYATGAIAGESTTATALSPSTLAGAVWASVIEAGYSAEQILRLIAAQAAGAATGLEGSNPQFTGLDGSTLRIDGSYSAGVRTIDALNAS
jgi:hypothetical protein